VDAAPLRHQVAARIGDAGRGPLVAVHQRRSGLGGPLRVEYRGQDLVLDGQQRISSLF